MTTAAERLPDLVDEAAIGRADERPGERPHERRHVVRQGHELLERGPARHVGAREDPPHGEADDDGQDRRHARHQQRVTEDVGVATQIREVREPVRFRRAGLRIAHAQRGLDEIGDRIEDEDGGAATDHQADKARARSPGPSPLESDQRERLTTP